MAEQQLVDYIKNAKKAGQSDEQTKSLLAKNGWTEIEIGDAFVAVNQVQPQAVSQPKPQPQIQAQPKIQPVEQTKVEIKTQPASQPQTQPQIQTQTMQDNMPRMKTKSHIFLKLLMVLMIVVVLVGAGLVVASQYINLPFKLPFNISLSFFRESPEKVIASMVTNMQTVKTNHSKIQMDITALDNKKVSQGKISLTTDGDSDSTDIKNPKANLNFTVNLTVPGITSPASVNANAIISDSIIYLKFNSVNIPAGAPVPGLDAVTQLKGKWFKINKDSMQTLSQLSGGQITQEDIPQTDNSALIRNVQNLFIAENLLSVTKDLGNETISGQNSYHYSVVIKKEKLADLLGKMSTMALQEAAKTQPAGSTANSGPLMANVMQAFIKTITDSVGDINMEIWIGKKDYMLYQAKLDKTVDIGKIVESISGGMVTAANLNGMQTELKLIVTNSNFNKPVAIQAPAGAQNLEDVLEPIMKLQQIESDLGEIGSIAQLSSGSSNNFSVLCKKGLLNGYLPTYGADLIKNNNDIVSLGAKKPACFSDAQDFCVSTQLADGSYLCVDKNNIYTKLGNIKCISAKTACRRASKIKIKLISVLNNCW